MFVDVKVFLVDEINAQDFVNSFSSNNVKLYFITQDAAIVRVRTDFLEEFLKSSYISRAEVQENLNTEHDGAPAFPSERYQQGTPTSRISKRNYVFHKNPFRTLRPQFGSSDDIATQKAAIQNAQEFIYLGSHYMGSQMFVNKLNRMNDNSGQTTLPTVGRSPYDNYHDEGPYGYSTDPVNSPKPFQYNSRFFGKNVDILVFEPSNPMFDDDIIEDDLRLPDHPEWKKVAENDANVLGNDRPNLGDAPEGNYNHSGSRLYLQDWPSFNGGTPYEGAIIPSTGTNLGGKMSLLSRYNNERLSFRDRAPITYHMAMCLSLAGGNMGGYAKSANLYPRYQDDGMRFDITVDNIISWHNSKPVNPETGLVNPTIVSCSFHFPKSDMTVFVPIDSIKAINHLGKITNKPAGGWGTNLTPFVEKRMIPYRFKNPTTNTWVWALAMSGSAVNREGENFGIMENIRGPFEKLANSGITVVASAGNTPGVYVRRDAPEYNDHVILDENAEFFQGETNSKNEFTSFTAYAATKDEQLYTFRVNHRNYLRDSVILVGAGQQSATFPGLINYSARGPAIDIIGDSNGSISAYTYKQGDLFPVDTNFGSGADINPSSSMYSNSVPFPFEGAANAATQTFANPGKGIDSVWADNDSEATYSIFSSDSTKLYRSERLFTSDGASPQQNSWSTPAVIAQTGTTDNTDDNTIVRFAYRKNSNTQTSDTSGANFLNATADSVDHPSKLYYMDGLEDEWVTEPPALTADGDIIYRIERVFTKTLPHEAGHVANSWSSPVIVGRRVGSQDQKTVMLFSKDEDTIKFTLGEEVRINSLGTGTDAEKQNNWRSYLNTTSVSAGNFVEDTSYTITNLGSGSASENQSRWNALLGRTDFQPKVWASEGVTLIPGARYEIVNLGTGDQQTNWNTAFSTTGVNYSVGQTIVVPQDYSRYKTTNITTATLKGAYAVGDTFIFDTPALNNGGANVLGATVVPSYSVGDRVKLPVLAGATPPPSAKISHIGFAYTFGSGTSAACPSVAGRLACMAEEYLHKNNVWPTTQELKALLLNSAREVELNTSTIDWFNTPPASDAAVTGSQYHVFKSYKDVSKSQKDEIRDYDRGIAGGLQPVNNFTTRDGESKPSTLGWFSENISASSRTLAASSIVSSSVGQFRVPEYAFSRYNLLSDQPTTVISTLTSGNTGFRDNNNSAIKFKQGDRITVTNGSSYIDNMVSGNEGCVLDFTDNTSADTLKITHMNRGFGDAVPASSMTWSSDIPSDARNAFSITVNQLPTKTVGIKHYAELKNESGQNNPASMYCFVKLTNNHISQISVEADRPVNIKLQKVVDGVVGATEFNHQQSVLGSGTITSGEARTSVMLAGKNSLDRVSNARLWEQTTRAGFDFDKDGAADALTDGLLLLRYLFELRGDAMFDGAVGLNSPLTREEIQANVKLAVDGFGDIDANGEVDALTDGLLLLRYLFDLTGDALINDAIAENAVRKTAPEIENYIESLLPTKTNVGTFGYRSSTNSAVPHNYPTTDLGFPTASPPSHAYSVTTSSSELLKYNTPVGLQLFDTKYFVHANTGRNDSYATNGPYEAFQGTAWSWTQTSGQLFTSDMGTLNTTTFTDTSGATRTIDDMWWTNGQSSFTEVEDPLNPVNHPHTPKGIFCFSLRGTNIPNTSQTFEALSVNGVLLKRGDAYYSSDSNGNSVWWWHITCRPFADSDFEKLGKGVSDWFVFSKFQNNVLFTPSNSEYSTEYKLSISNIINTTDYTTLVDLVACKNLFADRAENHVHAPDETILLSSSTGKQSRYGILTTEPADTIPLRAHYESGKILSEEVTSIRNFKNSKPSAPPTVGAVFPAQHTTLSATNDMTELEANIGLNKFGWQGTDPGVVTPENENIVTTTSVDTTPIIPGDVPLLNQDYRLVMPGPLSDVAVPANGSFTVGPVLPVILPDVQEGATVFHPTITYQWQKSTNATVWTNIASNDSTYTNAQTNTLTVTNYSNQDPVGEYYRCVVSTTPVNLGSEFTNAAQAY